jgi:hypothetical protein
VIGEHEQERELEVVLAVAVLGIAAVGIVIGAGHRLPHLTPSIVARLHLVARVAALVATVVALLVVAAFVVRFVATLRTVRSRVTLAVVPNAAFDPSPESIATFAKQLVGLRRRSLAWLDRRATAFRVLLTTASDGRALYCVQVPRRFVSALATVFSAYEDVELVPAHEYLAGDQTELKRALRLELRLARSAVHTLRDIPVRLDPLQPFAELLGRVNEVSGANVVVAIDLLPVAPRDQGPRRRRLFGEVRGWTYGPDRRNPAAAVERRLQRQQLWSKFNASEPLFELQVLVAAASPRRDHARSLIRAVFTAFEQLSGENYLRAVGESLGGWFLAGSNLPVRRRWFDHRLRTGRFGPTTHHRLVSGTEVWGFLKPWTRRCHAAVVVQDERAGLAVAAEVPTTGRLVCVSAAGRPVAISPSDCRYHAHVLGPTGKGKSTLLVNWVLDDIAARRAVVLIDPSKGDTVRELLARIPRSAWDRVRLIDPSLGRERPIGLNVMEGDDPDRWEVIADQVAFVFRRLYERYWGPRSDDLLRAAVLTLLRHPGTTLCDIPRLLLHPEARRSWTTGLGDPIGLEPFWEQYEAASESQRLQLTGPLLYKLRSVLLRPAVRNILGQSRSTIDLEDILDHGGVLLVALPRGELGEETSDLLAAFLIARLWQVVQARSRRPESERPDATLAIDECHRVMHLPQTIDEVTVEARAHHLGLVLAHQHLLQLPPATREAVAANVHTKIAFQCEQDAHQLARWYRPLTEDDLMGLERFQIAARVCVNGRSAPPCLGVTRPMPASLGEAHAVELVSASLERWGRPRAEVEAEIVQRFGGLDEELTWDE